MLNQRLNAEQLSLIEKEKEEREKFKQKMNIFSTYFTENEIKEEYYREIARYIDDHKNKKHVENHTQYHLDKYHQLNERQNEVGLSDKENKQKQEHKTLADTGIKTYIVGRIREHGRAHGHSEDMIRRTTNVTLKEEKWRVKDIRTIDQIGDKVNEDVSNKFSETRKSLEVKSDIQIESSKLKADYQNIQTRTQNSDLQTNKDNASKAVINNNQKQENREDTKPIRESKSHRSNRFKEYGVDGKLDVTKSLSKEDKAELDKLVEDLKAVRSEPVTQSKDLKQTQNTKEIKPKL
ncbi:MAG: hypothetical protein EOP34_04940 [Rickettsiales bacterium]|nr:MAG: hypothetical protein EOP34_04940 [Rickettsiales bacterium]